MAKRIITAPKRDYNDREAVVYMLTNKINGKRYIGITIETAEKRFKRHVYASVSGRDNMKICRAIRKYGAENFKVETVYSGISYQKANEEEIRLIKETKPEYNITAGGKGFLGYNPTPEVRKKISERNKGKPGYWKGKKLPLSVVLSQRARGKRKKKVIYKPRTSLCVAKLKRQRVVCLNDGNIFDGVTEACKFYNLNTASVSAVCRHSNVRKTAGGMVFRFFGDHFGGVEEAERMTKEAKESQKKYLGKGNNRASRPVVDLKTGINYVNAKVAAKELGIHRSCIYYTCSKKNKGNYYKNTKHKFQYLD